MDMMRVKSVWGGWGNLLMWNGCVGERGDRGGGEGGRVWKGRGGRRGGVCREMCAEGVCVCVNCACLVCVCVHNTRLPQSGKIEKGDKHVLNKGADRQAT
jgi:hypothetical protein